MNQQANSLLAYVDPTPRQREFIEAWRNKRFVLFGGAAGPGKSYMLRWSLVLFLVSLFVEKKIAKARVALFCEDYPSLYDRQISKIDAEFPSWLGKLKRGDTKEFVLHEDYGGGAISLRNLDDPSKYLSSEFAASAVDELTRNTYQTFNDLRLRLRWPGVDRPLFLAATNPGGIGHAWVKKLWIDRVFPEELKNAKLPDGSTVDLSPEFGLVRALPSDNPHLSKQYWVDLATLPAHMRKPYLEGDWNVLAGQYFPFEKSKYEIQPPKLERWWPKWISGDWGWKHPMCWHWHTRQDDGKILTYREWWAQEFDERLIGAELGRRSEGETIDAIYLGPDAWAKRSSQHTIAEEINAGLPRGMPQCEQADNDRIGGARLLYNLLKSDMLGISVECPKLLECLPEMIHGEDKELEDVLKVDWSPGHIGDDPYDSERYGIKSYLHTGSLPLEVKVEQRVEAAHFTDPTSEMVFRSKWAVQEKRKMQPKKFGRQWRRPMPRMA